MDTKAKFISEREQRIRRQGDNKNLRRSGQEFLVETIKADYSYNFSWMGRPIIQYPQDMVAMQEIIWQVRPDLIVETGIAHGGSIIFYASMLALLGGDGQVIGIDVDIRAHNRLEIEKHPMFERITMIEGSSIDAHVVGTVYAHAKGKKRILVCLDALHTHDHVLAELKQYAPLVTKGSYLIVFDTIVEDLPADCIHNRPWSRQDNPKTAVRQFLDGNDRFAIDSDITDKLIISVAPNGYLKCLK